MTDTIETLIPAERIQARVRELAAVIRRDHAEDEPVFLAIKHGGLPFARDITAALGSADRLESVEVSSYRGGTRPAHEPVLHGVLPASLRDREVLVLDDILDSGKTLAFIRAELLRLGARAVRFCVLLRKGIRRDPNFDVDYVGFEIRDEFVVGYGLDYQGRYRELPYVGILRPA